MIKTGYVAALRSGTSSQQHAGPTPFADRVRSQCDYAVVIDTDTFSLATTGDAPLLLGDKGAIVGGLYERATMRRVHCLGPAQVQAILQRGAPYLRDQYWGAYVAFIVHPQGCIRIFRAPLGEMACYTLQDRYEVIAASDARLCAAIGRPSIDIDWDEIPIQLAARDLRRSTTCLVGMREVIGGHVMEIASSNFASSSPAPEPTVEPVWSPMPFCAKEQQVSDRDEAIHLLGTVARSCITARARDHGKVMLMLSGGLDSSIIAACLAEAGIETEALNLVTRDAAGDERHYARQVAQWLGMPLHEPLREVAQVDVSLSHAACLPRPERRLFTQESARLARTLVQASGATALFNGGGGDNVFCSLQSAGPAADRLLANGPGCGFLRTAVEISRLAPAPLGHVVIDALRRAWFGKPALKPARNFCLLPPEVRQSVPQHDDHPWLAPHPNVDPGKWAHVRLMAYAQNYVEGLDAGDPFPTIAPLMSQPLVEACLRIPTWLWFEDGRNRVVARQAFARYLPPDIVARRSKGTPDSFAAEIFETYRPSIRELLADGALATRGLIDRDAVLAVIDDPRPAHSADFHRVLDFVDIETWAGSWNSPA